MRLVHHERARSLLRGAWWLLNHMRYTAMIINESKPLLLDTYVRGNSPTYICVEECASVPGYTCILKRFTNHGFLLNGCCLLHVRNS